MDNMKRLLLALATVPSLLIASPAKPCNDNCPYSEIEEMWQQPYQKMLYGASSMTENEKAYFIRIDLPGMDKKDISVENMGNRLVVSGERKEESESKEGSAKSYRQFKQSFSLPDDANFEAITATSLNGVLKITVPKTAMKKAAKKIEIR